MTQAAQAIETRAGRFTEAEGWWARQSVLARTLYWGLHAACLLGFAVGVSTGDFVLFLATFFGRMFFITGGYHRYFSHKSFKTGRVFQFVLAWFGASSVQKGPLWWASLHRHHHAHSDDEHDIHSPLHDGFWHSHAGWILCHKWDHTMWNLIPDLVKYPEMRWINRYHDLPYCALEEEPQQDT